ncbi:MAG: hypothetical protein OSA98_13395 [Rubripirellula sp.]|nr:hypothetical protein [Rubripirellula sp.]
MGMTESGSLTDRGMFCKSVCRGTAAALICAIVGGVLITIGSAGSVLGVTMFLFLPAAIGFVTVITVHYLRAVAISLSITLILCLVGLVFTGLEGIVCVVMATPILVIGAMLGAAAGSLVKQQLPIEGNFSLAIVPVLAGVSVFGAGKVEDEFAVGYRAEVFESSIIIQASPEEIWDEMIEFDDVKGPKPLLMKMGLPVPLSCSVRGSGVGSERICRFSSGFIRERVSRWNAPYQLEFDVEEVQLPGRHWLGFQRATYSLERRDTGSTKVTRTTTVTSSLRPAFYWRFFERIGTETEHDYILNCLKAKVLSDEG